MKHTIDPVYNEQSQILILGQLPVREVARAAIFLWAQAESILESACGRTWMRCPAVGRGEESDAAFASYRGMGCDPKL